MIANRYTQALNKILLIVFLCMGTKAYAQDDVEYKMEIGGGLGMVAYEGDFNGSITHGMKPMASVLVRRIFNPYMGLRLAASYGKIKGSSADADTYYQQYQTEPYDFDKSLLDVSLTYEYNFWPYGTGRDYRGAKRLTPFVFGGLGATYVNGSGSNAFTANVPLGIGVKYKIGERTNLGLEWAMHFSMSDKLDGVGDPYGIKSSGLFKNTDCYSALMLTLTYSFMPKCRTCHNQDED